MRKPTMQEIADSLALSRVTVWKVFNNYPGVSENSRIQILEKARELGYIKQGLPIIPNPIPNPSSEVEMTTISVVVSRPESALFWMNIIHQIAKVLNASGINLMYTFLPAKPEDIYPLPSVLSSDSIQGMIILNVYDFKLLSALNKLTVPKVFLDITPSISPDTLTGDLLLLEGKSTIYRITDSIIKNGHTEIGFIGDIQYAQTNKDRYDGFVSAMNHNNLPIRPELCFTDSIGITTYSEQIYTFLDGLKKIPQAIVCVSDYVAHFLIQYLADKNYKTPKDIVISAYDGSTEYSNLSDTITTVQVDPDALGQRLVMQLLYRIANPDAPLEVIYLYSDIVYGVTRD